MDHNENYNSHSSSFDNLKPSVLIIILILLTTLLISISICFLLRYLNRFNNHRHRPSSSATVIASDSFRVSPVLDSLPIFKFSSINRRSNNSSSSGDCAVCLSKFESDDQLRLLPLCCHVFHVDCIDIWLSSNQTCPLCRSPLFASESDLMKSLVPIGGGDNSFRLEIGSISRRRHHQTEIPESVNHHQYRSYSIGSSFDYIVDDDESEISESNFNISRKQQEASHATTTTAGTAVRSNLAAEIGNDGGSRNWLKDYVDRLSRSISSRAMSFRSSGRFFGSSRRSDDELNVVDLEANRSNGEEISEIFRWISGDW